MTTPAHSIIAVVDDDQRILVSLGNLLESADYAVAGTLHDTDFMVKDSKRFSDSGSWGYAEFEYDTASDTFRPGTLADNPPQGNDAKCGFACHTLAQKQDYVFTEYPKR